MKKIMLFLILSVTLHWVYAQEVVLIQDKNAVQRTVGAFHAIKISHAINVIMKQGNEEAVVVSASEDKYRDRIKTETKDGVLRIWYDASGLVKWKSDVKPRAYISFRYLKQLEVGGASDVKVEGTWRGDEVRIDLNGASGFKADVAFKDLVMEQSGASNSKVSGKVANLVINVNGASDFKGYDLVTDVCKAEASGASDIQITVSKELKVNAGGASDVSYRGTATISELRTSGAGTVKRREK